MKLLKRKSYWLVLIFGLSLIFSANLSYAGLVPCGTGGDPCTLCHLITGIQGLLKWGMSIVITVALVALTIAGIMYMVSAGDEEMMGNAKSFMKAAIMGTVFFFCAWLLVNITFYVLGASVSSANQGNWWTFSITCDSIENLDVGY